MDVIGNLFNITKFFTQFRIFILINTTIITNEILYFTTKDGISTAMNTVSAKFTSYCL